MFDNLCIALQERRLELMRSGPDACESDLESAVRAVCENGDVKLLPKKMQQIARENVLAALRFRDELTPSLRDCGAESCLFVHGSTGRGRGQIAPNIDFSFSGPPADAGMRTVVIPECRDDLDLVLVTNDAAALAEAARLIVRRIATDGIGVTVNIVTWEDAYEDLRSPDSPALRRILLFNRPKALFGASRLHKLSAAAAAGRTWLDWPHEADFRLLMQLACLLSMDGAVDRDFSAAELLTLWPTLYLACTMRIHTGFPLKRMKIKEDGWIREEREDR